MKLRGILPSYFPATWLIAYPTIRYFRETGRFTPDEETGRSCTPRPDHGAMTLLSCFLRACSSQSHCT